MFTGQLPRVKSKAGRKLNKEEYTYKQENDTSTMNIYLGSYLTRALKSSLRFSCSTASSFNSLLVVSKAVSA